MESIGCGIEKTKALVEGGADIDYKTLQGKTAAIMALREGGPNATLDGMEYAYYLIAEKKQRYLSHILELISMKKLTLMKNFTRWTF
ncbi:hypothetical protein [Aminipila sp.]|uniref:hypothetical protein n=1 Tax=Aminipila sp. TaxID=2060095 RepID=UPI002897D283|nr:hypothetical protein [Aminipila sp.]